MGELAGRGAAACLAPRVLTAAKKRGGLVDADGQVKLTEAEELICQAIAGVGERVPSRAGALNTAAVVGGGFACRNLGYLVGGVVEGALETPRKDSEKIGRFTGAYCASHVVGGLKQCFGLAGTSGPPQATEFEKAFSSMVASYSGSRTGKWVANKAADQTRALLKGP